MCASKMSESLLTLQVSLILRDTAYYDAPGRPQRPESIGSDPRGQLLWGKAQATEENRNGTEHKSRIMSQTAADHCSIDYCGV
jgi:hypothetical protein